MKIHTFNLLLDKFWNITAPIPTFFFVKFLIDVGQ